jgi:hypothetical protein
VRQQRASELLGARRDGSKIVLRHRLEVRRVVVDAREGADDKPENAPDVWRAMTALRQDRGMLPLAELEHRRTKPVPEGYLAFCCPTCGILQGDFDLRN